MNKMNEATSINDWAIKAKSFSVLRKIRRVCFLWKVKYSDKKSSKVGLKKYYSEWMMKQITNQ